ncbi:MAG: multidrug resistance efflux pump [Polaribacter sp.]|jgi:multidrug resistance efflux pump
MNFSQDPINTLENLIAKNKTKSISIYLVIVLALLIFLALLPVIKVDISSQSRGMVRSTTDNVPLTSLVNGKVTFVNLKNNRLVQKGDTLVEITQENLDTEKANNQVLSGDLQDQIRDLALAILAKSNVHYQNTNYITHHKKVLQDLFSVLVLIKEEGIPIKEALYQWNNETL